MSEGRALRRTSRHARLLLAASLAGALALAGCGDSGSGSSETASGSSADAGEVTYVGFGGTFQDAERASWLEPFAKETGIEVHEDQPIDIAKLKAMQESGNVTWDVISTSDSQGYDDAETLERIDCAVVDCRGFVEGVDFNGYRMPYYTWAVALAYNTDKLKEAPQGWADFFDTERFPGKRALWSQVTGDTLEVALIADGVKPEELYPLDVDRALKKLGTIKDDIIWFETGDECRQLLASGEAVMGNCWNGRIYDAQREGEPVGIQWNQCFQLLGALGVPKGAKNPENAMKLIAHMTSPENNAQLTNHISYGPTKEAALRSVNPEIADALPTSHAGECIQVDRTSLVQDGAAALEKLQQFQAE